MPRYSARWAHTMAAAGLLEEFEKLVECPICNEVMTDARHLSCLHVFCTSCVQTMMMRSRDISCPMCRVSTRVPDNGMDGFPRAFFLNSFGETVKKFQIISKGSTCSVCTEKQQKDAEYLCLDCSETLCNDCRFYHSKFHAVHRTVMLTELGKPDIERFLQNRKHSCVFHNEKVLEYFCKDCKQLGCVSCCIVTHKGHNVLEMSEASADHKKELEKLAARFDQQLKGCLETSMKLDRLYDAMERRHVANKERVKKYISDFKALLDQEEDRILKRMEKQKSDCSALLQSRKEVIIADKQQYDQLGCYLKNIMHKGTPADVCLSFVNDQNKMEAIVSEDRKEHHVLPSLGLHFLGELKHRILPPPLLLVTEVAEFIMPYKPAGMTTMDGKLVVCEWHGARVGVYGLEGSVCARVTVPVTARTWDVVCHGKMFIVSDFSGFIHVMKSNGALKHSLDIPATIGLSKEIMSVSISQNTLYISFNNDPAVYHVPLMDVSNGRLSKKALVQLPLNNMLPSCMDTNASRMVVSFQNESQVKCYDTDGNTLFTYGTGQVGSGDNELNMPTGVAIDSKGYVVIADTFNHRVVILSPKGQLLGYLATEADGMRGPRTVTFGSNGEVVVSSGGKTGPWKIATYTYTIVETAADAE